MTQPLDELLPCPPLVEIAAQANENRDYVSVYVTPKGEEPQHYRLSKGGAETLAAEIAGVLNTRSDTELVRLRAMLEEAATDLCNLQCRKPTSVLDADHTPGCVRYRAALSEGEKK